MTTQPDHATEARKWLGDYPLNARSRDQMHDRLAIAQTHALLAIADQLAAIARRLPSRPERAPMSDVRRWPANETGADHE